MVALLAHYHLQKEIAEATWIASLKDDWDEHGSPGYSAATFALAADTLQRLSQIQESRGSFLPVPKILPGVNGRLELRWRSSDWRLLMQVHPDDAVTFYGQLRGVPLRGGLPADEPALLDWIDSAVS